jgi:hypothetical protein
MSATGEAYTAFVEAQDEIYGRQFEGPHRDALLGNLALVPDKGADDKGAYLVAFRYGEGIEDRVGRVSLGVGKLARAVLYGPGNAHTTLSDHGLAEGLVIDPGQNPDEQDVLDTLTTAVRNGLQATGRGDRDDVAVNYGAGYRTNATTAVALGQPSRGLVEVRNRIIAASADLGVVNAKGGTGLGGSWGTHMTIARNLDEQTPEVGQRVAEYLDEQSEDLPLGEVRPTRIDVGYFHVSRDGGFNLTVAEPIEL